MREHVSEARGVLVQHIDAGGLEVPRVQPEGTAKA
jgi:hypothetical protein